MPPNPIAQTLRLDRLRSEDTTWRLLRADNAALIAGLLGEHLGGDERRLHAAELYERMDADLGELRALGLELPKNAQGYCADWRGSGFLVRRPAEEARGETFELSPGAITALRVLAELESPRQTATESRLQSIADQLGRLATETDPDATRRLAQLYAERDRVDARIERLHAGDLEVLDDTRATERMRDILAQVVEVPNDFARVRSEFDELNRMLRQRIVEAEGSQRRVLDDVFRGVDLISDSPEGRTFAAFNRLVVDPELGAAFDGDVDQVLELPFASAFSLEERRALRRFLTNLRSASADIHDVVTAFARGLRRYVQTQEFQRDRELRKLLRSTLAAAVDVSAIVRPWAPTELSLDLTAVPVGSVGAVSLHNPSDYDAREPIAVNLPEVVDLDLLKAITRLTEIDFNELIENVNAVVDAAGTAAVTVGEILNRKPATQGVASVIGLISLAGEYGCRDDARPETVRWTGTDGVERYARVPEFRFEGRIA